MPLVKFVALVFYVQSTRLSPEGSVASDLAIMIPKVTSRDNWVSVESSTAPYVLEKFERR